VTAGGQLPVLPLTALVGTKPSVLPLARDELFATLTPSPAALPLNRATVLMSALAVCTLVAAHRADTPREPAPRATELAARNADWFATALAHTIFPFELQTAVVGCPFAAFEALEADRVEFPAPTVSVRIHDDEALALRLGKGIEAPMTHIGSCYGYAKFLLENFV
jgi:hypothetical protein